MAHIGEWVEFEFEWDLLDPASLCLIAGLSPHSKHAFVRWLLCTPYHDYFACLFLWDFPTEVKLLGITHDWVRSRIPFIWTYACLSHQKWVHCNVALSMQNDLLLFGGWMKGRNNNHVPRRLFTVSLGTWTSTCPHILSWMLLRRGQHWVLHRGVLWRFLCRVR
jgi:hypothetical protein